MTTQHRPSSAFEHPQVRKIRHENEWFFCVNDIIVAITKTKNPKQYLKDLKSRDKALATARETLVVVLELPSKRIARSINCASFSHIVEIIQSLPMVHKDPFMKRYASNPDGKNNYLESSEHKSKVYPQTAPKKKALSALEMIGLK